MFTAALFTKPKGGTTVHFLRYYAHNKGKVKWLGDPMVENLNYFPYGT